MTFRAYKVSFPTKMDRASLGVATLQHITWGEDVHYQLPVVCREYMPIYR